MVKVVFPDFDDGIEAGSVIAIGDPDEWFEVVITAKLPTKRNVVGEVYKFRLREGHD